MAEKKMTQSQLMANLVLLYDALSTFLTKFAQSADTSYSKTTKIEWYGVDGEVESMTIPSLGYMKTDLESLHDEIEDLINNNDDKLTLRYKDGSVKSFEMKKVSELLDILNSTKDTSFEVPTDFKAKSNWIFESFLNPLLYIPVNISSFLNKDNDIKRFSVRRIILNTPDSDGITFFNNSFNSQNDLDYDTSIKLLNEQGILYNIDDNEYDLAACINSKRGSFSVLKISTIEENVDGTTEYSDYYQLDKLTYANTVKNSNGSTILEQGDILITSDNSEYKVEAVVKDKRMVKLRRVFGSMPIATGAGVLKIKPDAYRIPELQVCVGYNEYELLFIKPISSQMDLTTDEWSKGFGIYTNNLYITLSDGKVLNLKEYYENYVADFGLAMLNIAKEKQVPSSVGVKPDAPTLYDNNLEVVCINSHVSSTTATSNFANLIATKNNLKSQINEIDSKINQKKEEIGKDNATVQSTSSAQTEIKNLNEKKTNLQNQLNTTLNQITTSMNSENNVLVSPKYRIRGFVDIPEPKESEYGTQEIIQMCVSYRYKSPNGNSTSNNAINHVDTNGDTVSAYFSSWNEQYSKIRKKVFDEEKGTYVWQTEDIADGDVININQIDIPITKGEQVEIRVKAVSEAGYPLNPLESDWSNIITVEFPEKFESTTESSYLAEQLIVENALSDFNNQLISMGLTKHLEDSFWTNEKYYAHSLQNIASGFFTSDYKNISAYDYLKQINDKLTQITTALGETVGEMEVSIICQNGDVMDVTSGSVINLPVEYYKSSEQAEGYIAEKTYTIRISNNSATTLELLSAFQDVGQDLMVDEGNYEMASLNVESNDNGSWGSDKRVLGYQSAQMKSQFIYIRNKNYGLSKDLYSDLEEKEVKSSTDYTDNVRTFPYSNKTTGQCHYVLCYDGNQWNECGADTNFCISTMGNSSDELTVLKTKTSWEGNLGKGDKSSQGYITVSHTYAMHVCKEDGYEYVGSDKVYYYQQAAYKEVKYDDTLYTSNYPVKIGFKDSDIHLIGKYTCGAYFFMKPAAYSQISVTGNTSGSTRNVASGSHIDIPLVFQYRCADKRGQIGGYDESGNTKSNVTYEKILGFDIYNKLRSSSNVFSFDVIATCKYKAN